MKALVFAAGLGTRLKPLTDTQPKALVQVAGKPLLEHVICKLIANGFDRIIVNVHHFAGQIIDFIEKNNAFGADIVISDERDALLDTGGGIKKAGWFLNEDEPFLVHNVDILSNLDLTALYHYHCAHGGLASLVVNDRETSRYLLVDNDLRLAGWENRMTGEIKSPYAPFDARQCKALAFSGIHLLSPAVFQKMESWSGKFSIIDFYLSIATGEDIYAYIPPMFQMIDVGTVDSLQKAEMFLSQ